MRSLSWPPRTPVAAAGLVWEGPRLLLLRTTYKPTWTLPGGCVEEGESPLQACLREVEEETGLRGIQVTGPSQVRSLSMVGQLWAGPDSVDVRLSRAAWG